jgi:diguanylate cyclase (GGDEF)-like protein
VKAASTSEGATLAAWAALVQGLPDPTWVVALPSLQVVAVNDAAATLLRQPRSALLQLRADHLLATPEDAAYWDEAVAGSPATLLSDSVVQDALGGSVHVRRSIRPLAPGAGQPPQHCVVSVFDVSAEHAAQAAHEDTVAELQATLESTADGILVTDLAGRIRAFNRRFAQLWAMPEDLLQQHRDEAVHEWMRRSVADREGYQKRLEVLQEAALLNATDRLMLLAGPVLERVARPLWSRGRPLGRVYSFRDLSERLAADERIETLARTDSLTGLPNRRCLADRVHEVAAAMRHDGDGFALLLVDLDRFRRINDTLGHDKGDRVLKDAAERLRSCMRQGDEIARVGGDQFVLLLRHADAAAAGSAAARLLAAVAEPWQLDGMPFTLTCSVGIALCPGQGRSADELLSHAEAAMRRVKQAGSNGLRFHEGCAGLDLQAHMRLDHAMRMALASNRFRLHYQPQVEMASGRVVGAEALIRWRDPAMGEVSPLSFIPVAEDTGFIVAIGDWVLMQAVRQAAAWGQSGLALPIAINVSALQFQQPQFVERVADALRLHELPPDRLELELTESILVHDADEALERLQALATLGVRLSIDDFGTGYSSLSYLKRFPIDKLKIDRSFIMGLPGDGSDAGIVRAIIQMARALGMQVLAEGVENEAQRRFLQDAGCPYFQGYLFAPALDALSFVQRVQAAPVATAPTGARIHVLTRR